MATANFYGIGAEQQLAQLLAEQQRLQQEVDQPMSAASGQPLQTGRYLTLNFDRLRAAEERRRKQQELENSKKRSLDVQGEWQKGLVEELRKYKVAREGEVKELPGPTEDGGPLQGRTQGNPLAFRDFLTSPYSPVRQLADSDEKRLKEVFDKAAPKASLGSITGSGGVPQRLTPQDKWEYKDGAWFNAKEGGPPQLQGGVTQETLPNGTLVNRTASGALDSVDKAPKAQVIMPGKTAMDSLEKTLPDSRQGAKKAADTIRSTETALSALHQGAKTGFGAEFMQNLRTAVSMVTGMQFDASTPTAVLQKALAENVVNEFGGRLGTGVSNADVLFMGKATGDLATDAKAIERILAVRAAAAQRQILEHNGQIEELAQDPKLGVSPQTLKALYQVKAPSFAFEWQTPEAEAAFLAGMTGVPYKTALERVAGMRKQAGTPAPSFGGGKLPSALPGDDPEASARRRMKALGLPYTPPTGR